MSKMVRSPFYNPRRRRGEPPRWTVTVYYRTSLGIVDVQHDIEEIDMLHDLIELGSNWLAIDRIEIRLTRDDGVTVADVTVIT